MRLATAPAMILTAAALQAPKTQAAETPNARAAREAEGYLVLCLKQGEAQSLCKADQRLFMSEYLQAKSGDYTT